MKVHSQDPAERIVFAGGAVVKIVAVAVVAAANAVFAED